jgi:hypothetical protein
LGAEALDYALDDQDHYFHYGDPKVDYGDEWPEVAYRKAQIIRLWGKIAGEIGMPLIAAEADSLAQEFEDSKKPETPFTVELIEDAL